MSYWRFLYGVSQHSHHRIQWLKVFLGYLFLPETQRRAQAKIQMGFGALPKHDGSNGPKGEIRVLLSANHHPS